MHAISTSAPDVSAGTSQKEMAIASDVSAMASAPNVSAGAGQDESSKSIVNPTFTPLNANRYFQIEPVDVGFEERSASLLREVDELQADLRASSHSKSQKPHVLSGRQDLSHSGRRSRPPSAPCARDPRNAELNVDEDDSFRQRQAQVLVLKQQHEEKQKLLLQQEHQCSNINTSTSQSTPCLQSSKPLSGGVRALLSWQREQIQQGKVASPISVEVNAQGDHGTSLKQLDGFKGQVGTTKHLRPIKISSTDKKRYQKLVFQMQEQQWRNECVERKLLRIHKFLETAKPDGSKMILS
jgi:hypothetical protein